jgi:alpha-glucosidase
MNKGTAMIINYIYGKPFKTDAVIEKTQEAKGPLPFGTAAIQKEPEKKSVKFSWTYCMAPSDIVFGLGETTRGINKRGYRYTSWCSDCNPQEEDTTALYGAHNFIIVYGEKTFGLFADYPGLVEFDIGYTRQNIFTITAETADLNLYIITPEAAHHDPSPMMNIVSQFRRAIGQSYIPPLWGFGFQQSRWGYTCENDVRTVINRYRENGIPLDAVNLDIDYMQDFMDFTINEKRFAHFREFVQEFKSQGIRFIPIIDAGVKVKQGYEVYDSGSKNNFFCKDENGADFTAGVWPGDVHFPDFLNPQARDWFGRQYKKLTDLGIEGFWNDMNEPALFYSKKSLAAAFAAFDDMKGKDLSIDNFFKFTRISGSTFNQESDYKLFYHTVAPETAGNLGETDGDSCRVRHDKVHNLFGYNMTRAAAEAFPKIAPAVRPLFYSRSSYIGAHRYGGIWTGDNRSFWSNMLLEFKMLPSLNMCGFLYIGADIGGFNSNITRDLLLRWFALGIFIPLMRDHTALGTREQECYQFENPEDFKNIIILRYRLIPFLYSEYVKAAVNNTMYFRPLSFDYPDDSRALRIEDQLMLGESLMIAPVFEQNATGRMVYLPEDMICIRWTDGTVTEEKLLKKGDHFITAALTEVVFFIKQGHIVPLFPAAECTDRIDMSKYECIGDRTARYELYQNGGSAKMITAPDER